MAVACSPVGGLNLRTAEGELAELFDGEELEAAAAGEETGEPLFACCLQLPAGFLPPGGGGGGGLGTPLASNVTRGGGGAEGGGVCIFVAESDKFIEAGAGEPGSGAGFAAGFLFMALPPPGDAPLAAKFAANLRRLSGTLSLAPVAIDL